jgi:hypothetical protein
MLIEIAKILISLDSTKLFAQKKRRAALVFQWAARSTVSML